jgi:Ribbon-helix-helix protein, copG family
MPRAFKQDKLTITIPSSVVDALREHSEAEETPVAEIIRRIISLIFLLDLLGPKRPVVPMPPADAPTRFTFFLPWPMMYAIKSLAESMGISTDEAVRRGIGVYFKLVEARAGVTPRPTPDLPAV